MGEAESVNIASHLPAMAKLTPHALAVIFPESTDRFGRVAYTHYTLKQLDARSDTIAYGLEKFNIRRNTRTVLMVTPSLDFFALTFALFKIGAIPVMVDPGIGIKGLGQCLAEAEPEAFIGIPKAQAGRIIFGWGKKTIKTVITVGRFPLVQVTLEDVIDAGKTDSSYPTAQTKTDDVAAILFTSGSTGISKGAVYTHGIFDSQVKFLRSIYGIEPGEMDLATFPLFALFGPALGMTAIIPDMDASRPAAADPAKLFKAIEDFGPTNMFASPALINKLGRYAEEKGIKVPSLKRVISAGAPARPDAVERFVKMLSPDVQVFTPYGATESLPVCNIGSDEILREARKKTDEGKGVCIGFPVPGITLEIIKISDTPIKEWAKDLIMPTGEIGEIAVKGPIVTREYYNRPESTELAKIPDPAGGGFYHRMGDVGYRDEAGKIWFCGRKSHRVETSKGTLFTIPCEAVFNTHPKVYRTALVGVSKNAEVQPVLCVELEQHAKNDDQTTITKELLDLGATKKHTEAIKTILFHPSFPVDIRHNAKIFREKLTEWAEQVI